MSGSRRGEPHRKHPEPAQPAGRSSRAGRERLRDDRAGCAEPSGTFAVRLTPRARHDLIEGFTADTGTGGGTTLAVRVTAPPRQDRANTALLRLLARALDVPVSSLRVVAGARSSRKLVAVDGMGSIEARTQLDLVAARRLVPASSAERVRSAGSNAESQGALDGHDDAR